MSLTGGSVTFQANFSNQEGQGGNFGNVNIPLDFNGSQGYNVSLSYGSGAFQYRNLYGNGLSVTNGTPLLLNLTNGSLLMPDTSPTNFADIGLLLIRNNSQTATLTMGGGANAVSSILGAAGIINIAPGGLLPIINLANAAYYAVVAGTANILQFVSPAGTINFDVMIAGH